MISIIIPLYDKVRQVSRTLDSVRAQIFPDYELIIIDDGSTDGSLGVVRDYLARHPRFAARTRLLTQTHAGVSAARNKGIRASRYDWIAFMDADDTWAPEYLQTQYALSLKYPACDVLGAAYGFSRGPGKYTPAKFSKLRFHQREGMLDNYFEVAACSHPPLSSITTIVRKKALSRIGGFPEGVTAGEDLLTWARLALTCRIAFNRTPMATFNQDPVGFNQDQRSRRPDPSDPVGHSLNDLLHRHPAITGLKQYIGAWHKMRTRIYLSKAMRKEAWQEWRKLVRFHPVNYKTWAYLLMLISPVKILP